MNVFSRSDGVRQEFRARLGLSVLIWLSLLMVCLGRGAFAADEKAEGGRTRSRSAAKKPDGSFLEDCAFVCVDIQPGVRRHVTDKLLPKGWKAAGFTAADVNAGIDYAFDVAYPNAITVADACRRLELPMIFIHWGCLFADGMDLDPEIRKSFLAEHGPDYRRWPHTSTDASSRPADFLKVRQGEYVIPKTGQDAFTSSNIEFVLRNLGAKDLILIGGHTGACLGKTSQSAKKRGFRTLCIEDVTFDARESSRLKGIADSKYDYVLTTAEFLALCESLKGR